MEHIFRDIAFQLSHPPTEEELSDLKDIVDIFKDYGLDLRVRFFDGKSAFLFITFDSYKLVHKKRRGAGAKKKDAHREITVGEARKMLETATADEVAADLGISRATLYRRLKLEDWFFV